MPCHAFALLFCLAFSYLHTEDKCSLETHGLGERTWDPNTVSLAGTVMGLRERSKSLVMLYRPGPAWKQKLHSFDEEHTSKGCTALMRSWKQKHAQLDKEHCHASTQVFYNADPNMKTNRYYHLKETRQACASTPFSGLKP